MTNVGFGALSMTVQPVFQNTGTDLVPVWTLNTTGIPAGAVVAGILDPAGGINRIYNPFTVGLTPAAGNAASAWLPAVSAAGLTATVVNDQYWTPAGGTVPSPNNKYGQVSVNLVPAANDTVRASSVMNFKVSPNAMFLIATGNFA